MDKRIEAAIAEMVGSRGCCAAATTSREYFAGKLQGIAMCVEIIRRHMDAPDSLRADLEALADKWEDRWWAADLHRLLAEHKEK